MMSPSSEQRYIYDADGQLVERQHLVPGTAGWTAGSATYYIDGLEEFTSAGATTKYYDFGGRAVAMRDASGSLHYLLADQLGSTSAMLAPDGTVEAVQKYWPYGAGRPAPDFGPPTEITQTDRLYTSQRNEGDDATHLGLYNYRARFYSTVLGKFVSADTSGSAGTADGQRRRR